MQTRSDKINKHNNRNMPIYKRGWGELTGEVKDIKQKMTKQYYRQLTSICNENQQ